MFIRKILKIGKSGYVCIPVNIREKMNLGFGENVVIGLTSDGVMYVKQCPEMVTPAMAKGIATIIKDEHYEE